MISFERKKKSLDRQKRMHALKSMKKNYFELNALYFINFKSQTENKALQNKRALKGFNVMSQPQFTHMQHKKMNKYANFK